MRAAGRVRIFFFSWFLFDICRDTDGWLIRGCQLSPLPACPHCAQLKSQFPPPNIRAIIHYPFKYVKRWKETRNCLKVQDWRDLQLKTGQEKERKSLQSRSVIGLGLIFPISARYGVVPYAGMSPSFVPKSLFTNQQPRFPFL